MNKIVEWIYHIRLILNKIWREIYDNLAIIIFGLTMSVAIACIVMFGYIPSDEEHDIIKACQSGDDVILKIDTLSTCEDSTVVKYTLIITTD